MNSLSVVERAARMAAIAHRDQIRKDGNIPYVVHPFMVARILTQHNFPDAVVAAGLVHDVLEDTEITIEQLRVDLGDEVATIVASVTNNSSLSWKEKKMAYIESVRKGSSGAKAVATADKIHNAESLLAAHAIHGETLWSRFNTGKEEKMWFEEAMLEMLKETWEHPLVAEYEVLVQKLRNLV
jgi:(p)ppGpp synthase/HD superfamily hydrolase